MSTSLDTKQQKQEWLDRLASLVREVRQWAEELDWSTREIEKTLEDRELGKYQVPSLLLQKEATRLLLEPIARLAPGAEGVVDLYLLPAYDDIASLYYRENGWELHYMVPGQPSVGAIGEAESQLFTKSTFQAVTKEMVKNATP